MTPTANSAQLFCTIAAAHSTDGVGCRRSAEQIALANVAAVIAQEIHLFLRLHSFGDHRQTEGVAHRDDGADDRRIALAWKSEQKRAVDLQRDHRQILEVRER